MLWFVGALLLCTSNGATAATVSVDADDTGHYQIHPNNLSSLSHGLHIANNRNYFVGTSGPALARNFFVFDTSQIPANIVSAQLLIDNGSTPGGVYTVRSVSIAIESLTANHTSAGGAGGVSNLAEGVAIYEALDDGAVFGCASLTPFAPVNDPNLPPIRRVETVRLNAAAIAALSGATGQIAIAGDIDQGNAFGSFVPGDIVSLVVSTEPDATPPDPCAATDLTVDADDTGHYQIHPNNPSSLSHGLHIANNRNYFVGTSGPALARNFFVFDTSQIPANVASAQLLIDNGSTPGGVYTVRSVSVAIETLTANHTSAGGDGGVSNLAEGVAIYEALDDGAVFGCASLTPFAPVNDPNLPPIRRVETVRLNDAAIAALSTATGQIAIAGDIDQGNAFGSFVPGDIVSLVVSTEPDATPPDPCVITNLPPTAVAGADQPIRVGDTVLLDGSASFDDNTGTATLLYSWSFSLLPAGSTASIVGADTATPSFVADVADTYVVDLIVTDEGGLSSVPDDIVVSADNLAPTASAGNDQLVIIGTTVNLSGSASTDPEFDPLSYAWAITTTPLGSSAMIAGASSEASSFIPDIEGTYQVSLVVSDFIGPGAPDTVQLTAATAVDFAEFQIVSTDDVVAGLDPGQVTTGGNQTAFLNFLSQAIVAIQNGDSAKAVKKLEDAMKRSDGCVLTGSPDGNGPGRDWVTDCTAQIEIYALLSAALDALEP